MSSKSTSKATVTKSTAKRGRPAKFKGNELRSVVSVLRKAATVSAAAATLKEQGKIASLPTLCRIAREAGIEVKRGRPRKAEAKASKGKAKASGKGKAKAATVKPTAESVAAEVPALA